MFPNIPLELVKKAVSNRWIKVKSHTKLDEKEFLKGLDFIINSVIKNLVDRAVRLSRESSHSENLDVVRKILVFNHYPQDLIEKHIKIRIEQLRVGRVVMRTQIHKVKSLMNIILLLKTSRTRN